MNYLKKAINKGMMKLKDVPLPVKASMAYMVVNFMQKGMSFLTAPVFTRILTTSEFGKISIYLSWIEVLGIFAMFNLYSSVYNNGILEYKEDKADFTFSMLMLSNFLTIFTFIIVWGFNNYVFRFLNISDFLICFMFFCFLFEPAFEFWKTQQRFEYRYKRVCLYSLLIMLGSPILAIGGVLLFPQLKVESRIVGGQFVTLLIGIGCFWVECRQSSRKISPKYWKYGFWFNLPLLPYMLSAYILNCSDRLMISYMEGDSAAGIYSIAYTIGTAVSILWVSVNGALTPTIYKRCHNGQMDTLPKLVEPIVGCYGIICIGVMGLAPEVIKLLAPSSYGRGMYVVPAIIGGNFFNSVFSVFSNIYFVKKKQKFIMFAGVLVAGLNFILNLIFIPRFGYMAAGYTTLVSYLVQYLGCYFLMDKVIGEKVYESTSVIMVSVCIFLAAAIMPAIYQEIIIRYLILGAMGLLIWKKRNILLEIF